MPEVLALDGCRPVPLAGYLKALGVLRLVAEQKDPDVAGWWEVDRFRLRTSLSREALIDFFLHEYTPTPIIAPWNGGSGFYAGDNQEGIAFIRVSMEERFAGFQAAIATADDVLQTRGLSERPKDDSKSGLIAALRARADAKLLAWIDAAVAITPERTAYPPLLGTGGNDGRLDFTNNFMQRLAELLGCDRPDPALASAALFDNTVLGLSAAAIGQFAPGRAGGVNSANGTDAKSLINGWDFVLMLEGAVVFAGGVSRRLHGSDAAHLTYPFTVRAAAVGFGAASLAEQLDSRGEFWAPLWDSPAQLAEVQALFREGRITLGVKPARDGLDAARAMGSLGTDRRIAAFQRFGFVKRQGLAFLATPLERRRVRPNPTADLLTDLDQWAWLEQVRRAAADDHAAAALCGVVRALEEAIFVVLDRPESPDAVQSVLIAIGRIARHVAMRPRLRDAIAPPPLLRGEWRREADDGSAEYRIAAALASLTSNAAKVHDGNPDRLVSFAAHLGPLDPAMKAPRWAEKAALGKAGPLVVWGEGSLTDNLGALVRRRVIDATAGRIQGEPIDLPRRADDHAERRQVGALTEDVAAFFAPHFDDGRCAALALGLAWTKPWSLKRERELPAPLPFAYASIAPLLVAHEVLERACACKIKKAEPPPALTGLLAAGRISEAVAQAQHRAFVAGLPAPFQRLTAKAARNGQAANPALGRRILAALAIPADPRTVSACLHQAYPENREEMETNDAN